MAGTIRVGIGGWVFAPWRGTFYPSDLKQADELSYASRQLSSIEINSTYRRTQTPESFAKWRDATPDGFVFALKGPMFSTNKKVLAEAGPSIDKFLQSGITTLGDKLGPINWQFMSTKKFDADDFAGFLDLLPPEIDGLKLRHSVEVRHETFRDPRFIALVRERNIAVVCPWHAEYPQIPDATADHVYMRFETTREDEPLGYSEAELNRFAGYAKTWAAGGTPDGLAHVDAVGHVSRPRDVFVYVIGGAKARNPAAAMALIARLS